MKTYLEDDLVRRTKGLDGGALAVLTRMPPMAESDSIPATATFTAPRAGLWTELMMGDPLGQVHHSGTRTLEERQPVVCHLGCPLAVLHPSTPPAGVRAGVGRARPLQLSKSTRRDIRKGWQKRGRMHSGGVSLGIL